MKQIDSRISELQQEWGNPSPAATNNAVVWVNSKEELAGLSDADIAQCKKDAESRGGKAPLLHRHHQHRRQPILTNLPEPRTAQEVYMASIHRADGYQSLDFNTFPIVTGDCQVACREGAELMGYDNYADYSLEKDDG